VRQAKLTNRQAVEPIRALPRFLQFLAISLVPYRAGDHPSFDPSALSRRQEPAG
jgi:hypothetical protein